MGLSRMPIRCSNPICVALSFSDAYPSPISLVDQCIDLVRKLGVRPIAFLAALLSFFLIVYSCVSVNIPRCVAWYLDFSS